MTDVKETKDCDNCAHSFRRSCLHCNYNHRGQTSKCNLDCPHHYEKTCNAVTEECRNYCVNFQPYNKEAT